MPSGRRSRDRSRDRSRSRRRRSGDRKRTRSHSPPSSRSDPQQQLQQLLRQQHAGNVQVKPAGSHVPGKQQLLPQPAAGMAPLAASGPPLTSPASMLAFASSKPTVPPTLTGGDPTADATSLYQALCGQGSLEVGAVPLPPGWERIEHDGAVLYLDHISREASDEPPWELWRQRAAAGTAAR